MEALRVLIVDANRENAARLSELLNGQSIECLHAQTIPQALAALEQAGCDLVIGELGLLGRGQLDGPRSLRAQYPDVPILLVAGEGTLDDALDCLTEGAVDLLFRPLNRDQVLFAIRKALAVAERRSDPPPSPSAPASEQTVFGDSSAIQQARATLRRAATSTATVLIRGESGTGKELFARAIHDLSARANAPFIKIDCASLPQNLLESELFGYERGAFTGAVARKPGRVELADGGTLFLDEIGELTAPLQAKLLRLLQDREFERLGGTRVIKVNVRVLAATHRDLEAMTERGEFRQDLFYRLNVVPLWLPPLRARRADIDQLALHFCARFGAANGKPNVTLEASALARLREQRWPGNIRQLQNFIERLVVLNDAAVLRDAHVQEELSRHVRFTTQRATASGSSMTALGPPSEAAPISQIDPLENELRAAERKALIRALKHTDGNRSRAARMLGVSRSTFYVKLQEHDLL